MSTKKQQAFELLRQGKRGREIAEILNVRDASVSQWKQELLDTGWVPPEKKDSTSMPPNFHIRWTAAVNRIRRYLGKEEFKVPVYEEENNSEAR